MRTTSQFFAVIAVLTVFKADILRSSFVCICAARSPLIHPKPEALMLKIRHSSLVLSGTLTQDGVRGARELASEGERARGREGERARGREGEG